ncbi:MAG: EamA family transporter [Actinobacteria bacterium]|nr:EamA family transporter [Actinomycetota bacterium]
MSTKALASWAPWIFTVIWSSGFVVAKYAFPHSDVIFFLSIRLIIAAILLGTVAQLMGHSLRLSKREVLVSALVGISLHAIYLGGVWEAISLGAPAGISAVITSLQPVLVSIFAIYLLGEKISVTARFGLILGLVGVFVVLEPSFEESGAMTAVSLALLIFALSGSTFSTLSQRKFGFNVPLLVGTTYQFLIAGVLLGLISLISGRTHMEWNLQSSLAMLWAVLVTSIAAVLLLLWMLTQGSAAKVSSLLYLVPPMTAVQSLILFGEKLNAQTITGIAMTALGVALVQKS